MKRCQRVPGATAKRARWKKPVRRPGPCPGAVATMCGSGSVLCGRSRSWCGAFGRGSAKSCSCAGTCAWCRERHFRGRCGAANGTLGSLNVANVPFYGTRADPLTRPNDLPTPGGVRSGSRHGGFVNPIGIPGLRRGGRQRSWVQMGEQCRRVEDHRRA